MKGFSLLETFVAVLLTTLIFFTLVSLYPSAMASIRRGERTIAASDLAQEAIEQAYSQTPLFSHSYTRSVEGVPYIVDETVSIGPVPRVQMLTVTVSWTAGEAHGPGSVTYQTEVFQFTNQL